ncbi:hypothetical protein LTR53_007158 [Teratosphaeriaceae sp. CCFEE 6253]|nr:hypothetical protein LTR53_007158 [Teratosphaeriaceae sp. CCFEE 6253]
MDFLPSTTTQCAIGGTLVALLAFLLLQPTNLVKWLQKKNYQYEVTFSLYMLTPTEKGGIPPDSILFLTISMLSTACILYLPDHVVEVSRRTYYYFAGDTAAENLTGTDLASKASEAVLGKATALAGQAYAAVVDKAATAQEAVSQVAESMKLV